jgi:recombinational DNA repair protein RecT
VQGVAARVVYEKDRFEYEYGLDERLVHVPSDEENPGPMTHVYAIFRFKDGGHHFDVMTTREVNRVRARSRAAGSGPWVTDYEEMARKTVLRRASKLSPASIEDKTARAITLDERADAGIEQGIDLGALELPPEADDVKPSEPSGLEAAAARTRAMRSNDRAAKVNAGEPADEPPAAEKTPPPATTAPKGAAGQQTTIGGAKTPTRAELIVTLRTLAREAQIDEAMLSGKYQVAAIEDMDSDAITEEIETIRSM